MMLQRSPQSLPAWLPSRLLLVLAFFLLSWSCACDNNQRTLAMIKPDGIQNNHTDEIKKIILHSGFSIIKDMLYQFDEDQAKQFYMEHASRSFFPDLIKFMTSGPVLVMVLEKPDAISHWRTLIGPTNAEKAKVSHPTSVRAMCGTDVQRNCVHGSDSFQSAAREMSFFFADKPSGETVIHDEL